MDIDSPPSGPAELKATKLEHSDEHKSGSLSNDLLLQDDICLICQEWGHLPDRHCYVCRHGLHDICVMGHIDEYNRGMTENEQISSDLCRNWRSCNDIGFQCSGPNQLTPKFEFVGDSAGTIVKQASRCIKNLRTPHLVEKYWSLAWKRQYLSRAERYNNNNSNNNNNNSSNAINLDYQLKRTFYRSFKLNNTLYKINDNVMVSENGTQHLCKIDTIFKDSDTSMAWVALNRYLPASRINPSDESHDNSVVRLYLDCGWSGEYPVDMIVNKVQVSVSLQELPPLDAVSNCGNNSSNSSNFSNSSSNNNNNRNQRISFACVGCYNSQAKKIMSFDEAADVVANNNNNNKKQASNDPNYSNYSNNSNNSNNRNDAFVPSGMQFGQSGLVSNIQVRSLHDDLDFINLNNLHNVNIHDVVSQLNALKAENHNLRVKVDRLSLQLRAAVETIKHGGSFKINYKSIPLRKLNVEDMDGTKGKDVGFRTGDFHALKQILNEFAREKYNLSEREYFTELQEESSEFNKCGLPKLLNQFVQINGESNISPDILIDSQWHPIREVLEKYEIGDDCRVPILKGEFGVRAKRDIPQNTILCQYVGLELSPREDEKYIGVTSEACDHNCYGFSINFEEEFFREIDCRSSLGREVRRLDQKLFWEEKDLAKKHLSKKILNKMERCLILDPLGREFGNPLSQSDNLMPIINDCRKDIKVPKATAEDEEIQNVQFVNTHVNKWPSAFMVTTKDVKQGEALWCYYGEIYPNAMKELESWKKKCNTAYTRLRQIVTKQDFDIDDQEIYMLE